MVSYRSQLYLQQVEGQNPVSRSKFEKQIRLLFLTSAHAVLATLVKFAALLSSHTDRTSLLSAFLLSFLN